LKCVPTDLPLGFLHQPGLPGALLGGSEGLLHPDSGGAPGPSLPDLRGETGGKGGGMPVTDLPLFLQFAGFATEGFLTGARTG